MLRAATELNSLKSISEDARVLRKLPSAKTKERDRERIMVKLCIVGVC